VKGVLPIRERGVCCPPVLQLPAQKAGRLAETLKALADPTRLQIMAALYGATDPVCVCDFTSVFNLSQPTISHHMRRLKEAGLVEVTKKGVWSYYQLGSNLDSRTRTLLSSLL
jgi:ArsR family transcriptional regulator